MTEDKPKYRAPKPDEFYYWEQNAAWVWGIEPHELFLKTRRGHIPDARNFCMYYMHCVLGFSQNISGARYGMPHDMVNHAKKSIKNLKDVDKVFKKNFNLFTETCKENKKNNDTHVAFSGYRSEEPEFEKVILKTLSDYASLVHYVEKKDDSKIFNQIVLCEMNFNTIKKYFIK